MAIKLKSIEFFESWTDILDYLDIVELEATVFLNMKLNCDIHYEVLTDNYKVTTVYENR